MRVFGLLGLVIVLAVGAYVYKQQIQGTSAPGGATANPRATIDSAGVRNDLVAIANAERRYFASNGKYVDLDELISNGDVSMQSPRRGPYTYSSDIADDGFRITATYTGDPNSAGPKTLSITQSMQITSE
jgi:hypothetical protein